MGKPVAGDVVVVPFPQSNLESGKRRPALVVAALEGSDLILCQITSRDRPGSGSIPLESGEFKRGSLALKSYIRPGRLFTIESSLILYTAATITDQKLSEVKTALRRIFS